MKKPLSNEERLIRALVVSSVIILVLLSTLMGIFVIEISGIKKEQLNFAKVLKTIQVKDGINGKAGLDGKSIVGERGKKGEKGDKGDPGKDSTSFNTTVIEQVPIQGPAGPQGIQGAQGPQGEAGPSGAAGKTVFTRNNPTTSAPECRYAGDYTWQPESECL